MAYLKRVLFVLRRLRNIVWLVVEDGSAKDEIVEKLLGSSGVQHRYFHVGPTNCWGNEQRNYALEYIKRNALKGVVYFADDDNFYDPKLFAEIRKTRRVSVFPVGHLGPSGIERPIIKKGRVVGWDAHWLERKYCVDMAGFAFHSDLLMKIDAPLWGFEGRGGEDEFLGKIIGSQVELEPLCNNCTQCYVWHDQPLGEQPFWTYFKNRNYRRKRFIMAVWNFFPLNLRQIIKGYLLNKRYALLKTLNET
jgi:hypothetical protein